MEKIFSTLLWTFWMEEIFFQITIDFLNGRNFFWNYYGTFEWKKFFSKLLWTFWMEEIFFQFTMDFLNGQNFWGSGLPFLGRGKVLNYGKLYGGKVRISDHFQSSKVLVLSLRKKNFSIQGFSLCKKIFSGGKKFPREIFFVESIVKVIFPMQVKISVPTQKFFLSLWKNLFFSSLEKFWGRKNFACMKKIFWPKEFALCVNLVHTPNSEGEKNFFLSIQIGP